VNGASSRAIYDLYRTKTDELKMPRISFIGHGIGLHLHEKPYLGAPRPPTTSSKPEWCSASSR
jgi:hypothetical protein